VLIVVDRPWMGGGYSCSTYLPTYLPISFIYLIIAPIICVSTFQVSNQSKMKKLVDSLRKEIRHQSKILRFDMSRPTKPLLIYTSSSASSSSSSYEDVLTVSDFKTSTDVVAGKDKYRRYHHHHHHHHQQQHLQVVRHNVHFNWSRV